MKSPTAAAVSAGVIILTVISGGAVSWTQDYLGGWFKCDLTLHTADEVDHTPVYNDLTSRNSIIEDIAVCVTE